MAVSVFPTGEGLKKPVLLWKNENPQQNIGAFNVEIDLSKYYAVLIAYNMASGVGYGPTTVIPIGKGGYLVSPKTEYKKDGSDTIQYRFAQVSETGVNFSNGATWGNTNKQDISIPTEIYGITEDFYNAVQPEPRV